MRVVVVMHVPSSRAEGAVHVVGVAPFHFDLHRGVGDTEMVIEIVGDGSEDLLSITDALLGDDDVATACDDA